MMSAAKISGILSRDSFTAAVCMIRHILVPLPLNTPVIMPLRTSSTCSSKFAFEPLAGLIAVLPPHADAIRLSCPAFSASVIFATSASTKPGTGTCAACVISARAGLCSHAAIAPAPISAARREIRVSNMFFLS